MADFLQSHWLDLFTTILGLIYIWLEYRAHIALWVVGVVMPALDVWLYWSHGLYGDAGMACYYTFAALYGFYVWRFRKTRKKHESLPIIFMPRDKYLPAISIVALWALARKFVEQWLFWIVVDAVCCGLYINKGIPFKALLYGLYVAIAIAGYFKWKSQAKTVKRDQRLTYS